MAATSVSVTVLHVLLQCHFTGCWPLLPSYSELLIFIGNYTSAICHQWEVHRLSEHADRLSLGILHAKYLVIPRRSANTRISGTFAREKV